MDLINTDSSQIVNRVWSTEQDGPYDKHIEIWHNGNWVPAFFKDLRKGDFFLNLDSHLNPDQCFMVSSNVKRIMERGRASFIVEGIQIVQAPSIKDIETERLLK